MKDRQKNEVYCVEYGFGSGSIVHSELFLTEKEMSEFFIGMEGLPYRKMYKTEDIWGFRERTEKKDNSKAAFVANELSKMLRAIDEDIESADYDITAHSEEFVYVRYKSGSALKICVTADSLSALSRDVLKRI